jgi:hypothetical protein
MLQGKVSWQTTIGILLLNLIWKDLHESVDKDTRALAFAAKAGARCVQNERAEAGLESLRQNRAYWMRL